MSLEQAAAAALKAAEAVGATDAEAWAEERQGLEVRVYQEAVESLTDAGGRGLGLLSIEERARLVGGIFKVTSSPDCGTALHVQIPLRALAVADSVQVRSFSIEGVPLSELLRPRDEDVGTA